MTDILYRKSTRSEIALVFRVPEKLLSHVESRSFTAAELHEMWDGKIPFFCPPHSEDGEGE